MSQNEEAQMIETHQSVRQKALKDLEAYEIKGAEVYLIDIIPLIEMIWADGKAQEGEIRILEDHLRKHVKHINELAEGEIITFDMARNFCLRFLRNRPDPGLMKTLRSLVAPIRLSTSDSQLNNALRDSLLATCLDIASSCVVKYPYGLNERFNPDEKRCFYEILESL
jgi:hypothetical protein